MSIDQQAIDTIGFFRGVCQRQQFRPGFCGLTGGLAGQPCLHACVVLRVTGCRQRLQAGIDQFRHAGHRAGFFNGDRMHPVDVGFEQ